MDRLFFARTAALLFAAFAANPAPAQLPTTALAAGGARISVAKSEAILGGSPSRLAAILTQQGAVAPAMIRPLHLAPAVLRHELRATTSRVRQPARAGQPDVFGSVAMRVEKTPLDQHWLKVSRARAGGPWAAHASSLRNQPELVRIDAINRYVNRRVRFIDDSARFRQADRWSTVAETMRQGRGDCEDYAVAKLQLLRAAGILDDRIYFVIVKDLVRRADHAVLVVRSDDRLLVLDNGTDTLLDSAQVTDYRPILTYASAGKWTHGYRKSLAPIEMASRITPIIPAAGKIN